ncbi:MAG TPA: hypothetical protein VII58_01350 [Acidobacteriaceae bacterium]
MTSLMSSIPVLIVIWAVVTGIFLALLAYNGTITRYEDNQLFLADTSAGGEHRQSAIVNRVQRTQPFIRLSGVLSALTTIAIVAIYTWDAWQRIHS